MRGHCSSMCTRVERTVDGVCDGLPDTTCFRKLVIDRKMSACIPSRESTGCRPFGAVRFHAKRMGDYEISRESSEIEIFVYFDRDECNNNNSRTKLTRSPGRWRASFDFVQILTRRRIKAEPQSQPFARWAYLFPTCVYDDTAFRR